MYTCALSSLAYSDYLDEAECQPGDEYLPLGPSFQVLCVSLCVWPGSPEALQEHVALFLSRSREGGRGLLTGDREEDEILRPETARLLTQLE